MENPGSNVGPLAQEELAYIASRMRPDRETAAGFAVRVLREAIITGVLKGGAVIRQDAIAEALSISKVPLREALRVLEAQRLIEFRSYRGYHVRRPDLAEMCEAFQLRCLLESTAVRASVPCAGEGDLNDVRRIIDEFERAADPMVASDWNLQLHLALYRPAQMLLLEDMITRVHTITQRYTHIHMRLSGRALDSQDEHRAILRAYEDRDTEKAATLMASHIGRAADYVSGTLRTDDSWM